MGDLVRRIWHSWQHGEDDAEGEYAGSVSAVEDSANDAEHAVSIHQHPSDLQFRIADIERYITGQQQGMSQTPVHSIGTTMTFTCDQTNQVYSKTLPGPVRPIGILWAQTVDMSGINESVVGVHVTVSTGPEKYKCTCRRTSSGRWMATNHFLYFSRMRERLSAVLARDAKNAHSMLTPYRGDRLVPRTEYTSIMVYLFFLKHSSSSAHGMLNAVVNRHLGEFYDLGVLADSDSERSDLIGDFWDFFERNSSIDDRKHISVTVEPVLRPNVATLDQYSVSGSLHLTLIPIQVTEGQPTTHEHKSEADDDSEA